MGVVEMESLSKAVADFGEEMRAKLWKKLRQGYSGWDDDSDSSLVPYLQEKLIEHVKKYFKTQPDSATVTPAETDPAQLVDIANLCMFLWRLERKERRP
jgi:hypothetical protein